MGIENQDRYLAAIIGAGPAGLYAAKQLASSGVRVALLNRDIKPGGLAEYGIYYNKYRMKEGLRKQFRKILAMPNIEYFGNVSVGTESGISLEDLKSMGFQAIIATVGAQGTKWLGLPGEDLNGVYHAKDIVYHYNDLPPYSVMDFRIGRRVALIGVGNVMMDIGHWTIRDEKVDKVIAVARRGPAEVKFTKKELQYLAANLDLPALEAELERVRPRMEAVGQDPEAAKDFIFSALPKAQPPISDTRFSFQFLSSPSRIIGDESGQVCGLEVDDTRLVPRNGDTKAERTGTKRILEVDTVVFCIGDRVDDKFGLPVQWNEFVKNPEPRFPINDISFEAYNPQTDEPIEGVFMAGWSREASSGLVGVARKDGESGARAALEYLRTLPPIKDEPAALDNLRQNLSLIGQPVVSNKEIQLLEEIEQTEAENRGLEIYKMKTNDEMLSALGFLADPA
jgi:ferredoxin--NADP+ reductase